MIVARGVTALHRLPYLANSLTGLAVYRLTRIRAQLEPGRDCMQAGDRAAPHVDPGADILRRAKHLGRRCGVEQLDVGAALLPLLEI